MGPGARDLARRLVLTVTQEPKAPAVAAPAPEAAPRLVRAPVVKRARAPWTVVVGRAAFVLGLVFFLFFVYLFWFGSITQARSQELLLGELRLRIAAESAANQAGATDDSGVSGLDPETADEAEAGAPKPPGTGDAVALLQIPSLDVEQVVAHGTSHSVLRTGPGHFRNTPLPGEAGNAAIAGRRTSFGAPFERIEELDRGDRIVVTTSSGRFRYRVQGVRRIGDGDPDPTRPVDGNRLTLVSSAPAYVATERVVVTARLVGLPVDPTFEFPNTVVDEVEGGLGSDWKVSLAPAIVWGTLLVLAFLGARWLYRNWLKWPTYLVSTPVLLALLIVFFESLSNLLPATY